MTATQAPTPGPLDAKQIISQLAKLQREQAGWASRLGQPGCAARLNAADNAEALAWAVKKLCDHSADAGNMVAPTAPVEASGSERERMVETIKAAMKDAWEDHASDTGCWPADIKRVSARGPLRLMFTPLIWAQMTAELAADLILRNRPQPSGETREQVARIVDPSAFLFSPDELPKGSRVQFDAFDRADRILALLSARPLALGGQKGDSETLRVLLDNLVIAQTLSKDIRQKATDEARSYLYGRRHTPARAEAQDEDTPCTDCGDTGVTHQTERRCSCQEAEAQDEGAAGELSMASSRLASLLEADHLTGDYPIAGMGPVCWDDLRIISQALRAHPSPTPAADADRVRIAVEASKRIIDAYFMDDDYDANGALRKVSKLLDATLKSTAAKEGGA